MPGAKTATLTFRMDPDLKEALRLAAERERRSITNMIEVLIQDYCRENGIPFEPMDAMGSGKGGPQR